MPTKKALERAQEDKREGKSASTQAGEFVRDEIEKTAYRRPAARALILSLQKKARFPKNPENAYKKGQRHQPVSPTRSKAREKALKKEGTEAASDEELSQQAKSAAKRRTAANRSAAAKKR